MSPLEFAFGYIASGVAAYFLFKEAHLFSFDFNEADRRFFVGLSCLGPGALFPAIFVYWLDKPKAKAKAKKAPRIIAYRKDT